MDRYAGMSDNRLKFFFDKKGDVLDIAIGKPEKAISRELNNDIVVRIDPKTKEIVGFMILNFGKRFEHRDKGETLPITATFAQIEAWKRKGESRGHRRGCR